MTGSSGASMEHHYTRVGNLTVVVGPTITVRSVTRMQMVLHNGAPLELHRISAV
ncbi:hypothetical protein OROGR_006437 [Orobanche gracilis]